MPRGRSPPFAAVLLLLTLSAARPCAGDAPESTAARKRPRTPSPSTSNATPGHLPSALPSVSPSPSPRGIPSSSPLPGESASPLPLPLLSAIPTGRASRSPSPCASPSPPALPSPTVSACPRVLDTASRFEPRIVGGSLATAATARYMAALHDGFGNFQCSAVVLSSRWVLTAQHCGVNSLWTVRLGGRKASLGVGVSVQAVHRKPVPSGEQRGWHDVSLLLLAAAAPGDTAFARVNVDGDVPYTGAYARAAGFGVTYFGSSSAESGQWLRQVDVPVVAAAACAAAYGTQITAKALCAGRKGCDSCQGDSGGPLMQFDAGGRAVVVGVVSSGRECATESFPGIYVPASEVVDWMARVGATFDVAAETLQVTGVGEQPVVVKAPSWSRPTPDPALTGSIVAEPDVADGRVGGGVWAWILATGGVVAVVLVVALLFVARRQANREADVDIPAV